MPKIEATILVKKNKKEVFNFFKNFDKFSEFMPNVRKSKVVWDIPPNKQIIEWEVDVEGINVAWKEEITFDNENSKIGFRMLEGDYNKYEGMWEFQEDSNGTKIKVLAEFDWGIPILGQFVGPVLEKKARLNFKTMLKAIKLRLVSNNLKV